jgi:hypothetical protein
MSGGFEAWLQDVANVVTIVGPTIAVGVFLARRAAELSRRRMQAGPVQGTADQGGSENRWVTIGTVAGISIYLYSATHIFVDMAGARRDIPATFGDVAHCAMMVIGGVVGMSISLNM